MYKTCKCNEITSYVYAACCSSNGYSSSSSSKQPLPSGRTQKDYAKLCKKLLEKQNPRTLNSSAFYKVKS